MAKKTVLMFLSLFLLFSCVLNAQEADGGANTETAENIEELADRIEGMFQFKVKELEFNLTPTFQIVLPDTSAEMGIKHRMGETLLEGYTKYNYIYSQINYQLKYTLDIFMPVSFRLYDDIKLESIYERRKYLQKVKGFGGGIETPELLGFIRIREELSSETFYVAQLQDTFSAEEGNLLVLRSIVDMVFRDGLKRDFFVLNTGIENSIPYEGNVYDYTLLNLRADVFLRYGDDRRLGLFYRGGYLLENHKLPVWKRYRLGGYDRMIGYNYDEYEGRYFVFGRARYDFKVFGAVDLNIPLFEFKGISMFVIGDIGCAGDGRRIMGLGNYKYSVGAGVVFDMTFRKKTKMKITLAIGQAIEQGRMPVFYLIHEI